MKIRKWFGRLSALLTVLVLSFTMLTGCSSEDVLYLVDALLSETTTEEGYYDETQNYELGNEDADLNNYETEISDIDDYDKETDVYEDTTQFDEVETEKATTFEEITTEEGLHIEEDGRYTSKEEVALYIHTYGKLPSNFITKSEAQDLGWESKEGNLWDVTDKMSIGGDRFGNYEGDLPTAKGRKYYECDINYQGGYRGSERIIYSNDGLIFYTNDHYETFEQLY